MLKTILKIALIVVYALCVIACAFFAFTLVPFRPPLLIALILLVSVPLLFFTIRTALLRKKEKQFVDRVISVDKQAISGANSASQPELLELQRSWKESIDYLRTSGLRKYGNPLYALPWYLVIGESRTGKSSMICHSGLSSPNANAAMSSTLSVTKNCDWWFFNEAIILDTAGRYTIPIDPKLDIPEWDAFLKLLKQFRRKEPINGIVATISAEKLLGLTPEELAEQGALVRTRVDQVMRSVGALFPIYIMVTKMDLVFGMPEFSRALPRSRLGQAMGWCTTSRSPYSDEIIDNAMGSIGENLRMLQSRLLHGTKTPEAEVLIFPKKFQALGPGLRQFCSAIFSDSVYRIAPQFRGIYFSSALQKVEQGGVEKSEKSLSDQSLSGGMFLKEFFSKVLPGDRKLFRIVPEWAAIRPVDRLPFKIGWAAVFALLIFSAWSGYKRNYTVIGPLLKAPPLSSDASSIASVERVRLILEAVHRKNGPLVPFLMGMRQCTMVEHRLRSRFTGIFEEKVHGPIENSLTALIRKMGPETSEDSIITAEQYLTALIELASDPAPDKQDLDNLAAVSGDFLPMVLPGIGSNDVRALANQYRDWTAWSGKETGDAFRRFLYDNLLLLLDKKGSDLKWCARYTLHAVSPVTMRDFWASAAALLIDRSDTVQVGGAFTAQGFGRIKTFLNHIDSTINDPAVKAAFERRQIAFYQWYWDVFYRQWYAMADRLVDGFDSAASAGTLRAYMKSVPEGDDPFLRFINHCAAEMDSADKKHFQPAWRDQILLLRDAKRASETKTRDSTATGLAKTGTMISGFLKKVDKQAKEYVDQNTVIRNRKIESALSNWNDYRGSLTALYEEALKPGGIVRLAKGIFSKQDSSAKSYTAALDGLQMLIDRLYKDKSDPAVYKIIEGPITVLRRIAYREANAKLQELWETLVLSKVYPSDPDAQVDVLFARDSGLVRQFLKDPFVAAFLKTAPNGRIVALEGPDGPAAFSDNFIIFVNKGVKYSVKSEYSLSVKTVPFSVNPDAGEEPYETILRLQCAEGSPALANFNDFETAQFIYRPSSCGEVRLKAVFSTFTAEKTWKGRWGFPDFLTTFKRGENVIKSEEFDLPSQALLQRKNIKWVKVAYELDPAAASEITGILENIPKNIPEKIITGL